MPKAHPSRGALSIRLIRLLNLTGLGLRRHIFRLVWKNYSLVNCDPTRPCRDGDRSRLRTWPGDFVQSRCDCDRRSGRTLPTDRGLVFDDENGGMIQRENIRKVTFVYRSIAQAFQRERQVGDEAVRIPIVGQAAA
jgi:hypothetical protein